MASLLRDLRNLATIEKIVVSAKRGALKVSLMNVAKVSHSEANSLLEELQRRGLLEIKKEDRLGTQYYSTPRGEDFVDLCQRLSDMLVEAPRARILNSVAKNYQ